MFLRFSVLLHRNATVTYPEESIDYYEGDEYRITVRRIRCEASAIECKQYSRYDSCFRYEDAVSKLKQALKTESKILPLVGKARRQLCHCFVKVSDAVG